MVRTAQQLCDFATLLQLAASLWSELHVQWQFKNRGWGYHIVRCVLRCLHPALSPHLPASMSPAALQAPHQHVV
jgi:hypothetical protein